MSNRQDDLDLLLSLQDRVLETPPASPSRPHSPEYCSDEGPPSRKGQADMSVFREAVLDCLDYEPDHIQKASKSSQTKLCNEPGVERFSGLRIRNLLIGDTLSGCWATVGVLTEKGNPRTSSTGKSYCIWKIGCLDETTVSLFLFGDAYIKLSKEQAGTVFALFNCTVRKDSMGQGFSLSLYSPKQVLKIGTSVDYGVCNGKRNDGVACTSVINKRRGKYCKFHKSKESQKYTTMRSELKGGNIRTAFRDPPRSEGIYMVDPLADKTNSRKPKQPMKLLSVEGLKKALSNAGKVTTNSYSQGIRFLTEITGKAGSNNIKKESAMQNQECNSFQKRKASSLNTHSSEAMRNQQLNAKRNKTEKEQTSADKTKQGTEKMIELDFVSSDEEM
ncbi:uncharacterized protein LOC133031924 isoform X2 [Cannabis sativa]|uniref:uncharacterized protein LOC133031924 isoform X2 n=1 Tax=Cannabis sativa TaxID=3483 RepID=UPI0029C9E812|nr:uncharacterized protein LOC133031924 isoform X2 [Cannabis sativa]